MERIQREGAAMADALARTRRRLHAFAECGFALSRTRELVATALRNMGYEPRDMGKGGIIAETGTADAHAPAVLLRADMDALPIREETRLPFRAENGCAHACGHDMHTAMLLGAAALLAERGQALPYRVRFVFETAEETLSGAKALLEAEVLKDVRAALALHVIPAVPYKTGTVLLPEAGVGAPAAVFFELHIKGESAHVGERSRGRDALAAALRLYALLTEETEALGDGFTLSVGRMTAGDAPNIVAGHAALFGTFRSVDVHKTDAFRTLLLRLARESKEGVSVSFGGSCPPLLNDEACLSVMEGMLRQAGMPFLTLPTGGGEASEDFALFAEQIPAVMLALAAGERGHGYEHPLHHPAVLFDEDALPCGAVLYAMGALALGERFCQDG